MRNRVILCTLLILLPTSGAFTQETPEFETGIGYAFVRIFTRWYDESLPRGFWVSVNCNLRAWIGITGDLSYARDWYGQYVLAAMAGPKITFRVLERVEPFVHVLGGSSMRHELHGDYWDSQGYGTLQPGGGIDIVLSKRVAVRAAVDYGVIFAPYEKEHQLRVTAGIAFRSAPKK